MSRISDPRAARPSVENLEDRTVPAVTITQSGGVLTINGDSWENSAYVSLVNNRVNVRVESVPSNGSILTPDVKTGSYSGVTEIRFNGRDGDDWFDSTFIYPCKLDGGAGNDELEGGGGADTIMGGSGNDTIRGVGGADNLYGANDQDKIYGGSGADGLYGGAGTDELYGGSNPDRFLVMSGATEHKDAVAEDAVITFYTGNKVWGAAEIERIDAAFSILHKTLGTTKLLKTSTGAGLRFERNSGTGVGSNNGTRIQLTDLVMNGNANWEMGYVLHEIGHHWDLESSVWTSFKKLSGWTQSSMDEDPAYSHTYKYEEHWWYKTNAPMASDYARSHPKEDFAESFAAYFLRKAGQPWYGSTGSGASAISAKINLIDGWVKTL